VTIDKVERAGGRIIARRMAFAGGGEVALVADPDGNVIGLWMRKRPEGKAEAKPALKVAPQKDPAKPAKPAPKTAERKPAKPAKRK
jgi:hypothetical protein